MQFVHVSTLRKIEATESWSSRGETGAGNALALPGLAIDLRYEEELNAHPAGREALKSGWIDQLLVLRDQ